MGRIIEMDVEKDGIGWGNCLRVKVEISLCKALARERFINIGAQRLWVYFKYEKLPRFYFDCGWIVHGKGGC